MKQFFNRNKILIGSLVFLIVYSIALVTFATPPISPYETGETLDPSCLPGDTYCTVKILPTQIGNSGKFLTTDGSTTSWGVITTDSSLSGDGTIGNPLTVTGIDPNDTSVLAVSVATTTALVGSPTYANGSSGVGATLTRGSNGALSTIDGTTLSTSDRILVKNQTSTLENGIYIVTDLGSVGTPYILTRATDSDTSSEFNDQIVSPASGAANSGKLFAQQTMDPVIGTDAITYSVTTSVSVTQQASGTQVSGQIPFWTTKAKQLSKGTTNLFWDGNTNRLGIGTSSPQAKLQINTGTNASTGLFINGTTGQTANLLNIGKNNNPAYFQIDSSGKIAAINGNTASISASNNIIYFPGGTIIVDQLQGSALANNYLTNNSAAGILYTSAAAADGSQIGHIFNTTNSLISGNKIASFKNNNTEKAYISYDGTASFTKYNIGSDFFATQDTTSKNTRIGSGAGAGITSGLNNTLVGQLAGTVLGSSSSNTFIGFNAGLSQTGGYENTFIGLNAGLNVISSTRSVAIGVSAGAGATTGGNFTAIGFGALASNASAADNVGIGYAAGTSATGSTNTFIGSQAGYAMTSAQYNIMLGYSADLSDRTDSNNFVAGSYYAPIYDVYIGQGDVHAGPSAITYHATGGSGTNITGGDFVIASGKATGSATGGAILFQTSDTGLSGTTLQSLSTKATILSNGNFGVGVSPTSRLHVRGPDISSTSAFLVTNITPATLFEIKDDGTFSLGLGASASNALDVAIGYGSSATTGSSIALGLQAVGDNYGIAIGTQASTNGGNTSIALGYQTGSTGLNALTLGNYASNSGLGSILLNASQQTISNDYNGAFKVSLSNGASSGSLMSLFSNYNSNFVLNNRTNITAATESTYIDPNASNTITLFNGVVPATALTITSVTNSGGKAIFNTSSSVGSLSFGDEVVTSGFSNYSNTTYYYRQEGGSTFSLHTTRLSAGTDTNTVAYVANDTGIITPQPRRPVLDIANALQLYAGDRGATNGKTGLIIRAEDGTQHIFSDRVGLANISPGYLLHVGSSSISSGTTIARFENAGGTCDVTPNIAGGVTCTSDERLKTDITDYENGIDTVNQLSVKNYSLIADTTHAIQIGLLAQEANQVIPSLVRTDQFGYMSISYSGLTPILTKAIQELDIKLEPLTSLDLNTTGSLANLIKQYLEDATNGLTKIFTGEVHTDLLCVGQTCVTESQLQTLLNQQNNQGGTSGTTSSDGTTGGDTSSTGDSTSTTGDGGTGDTPSDTTPPVLTLIGDSSVSLSVGDTYEEQGATAIDDTDGDITANIQTTNNIDINTPGTYTVRYTVTDSAANMTEITREVVVG